MKITNYIQKLLGRCMCCYPSQAIPIDKGICKPDTVCIIDYKETIPFVPDIQDGHVIKVYDGDTITIASKLPYVDSPLYRFQVRLKGIDCPEIKGKTEDEIFIALCAKKEMELMVMQKRVTLKNVTIEKYGRLLADVYVNDIYVNGHMLKNRLAVPYDGKTKKPPENWKVYHQQP
uniref:TNase-like domain-containing protein n=1 Tax=viral metagenome TaxID=1070528 RepID=A0A6C0E2H2_9ZZZZ